MTEWVAGLIANWPVWVVLLLAIIAVVIWFIFEAIFYGGLSPFEKKEWWQDREKRLALKARQKNRKPKLKVKRG